MRFRKTLSFLILETALVSPLSTWSQQKAFTQEQVREPSVPRRTQPEPKKALSAQDIAHLSFPSVVLLVTQDDQGQPLALGSGFFVRPGIIATSFHVIEGAARAWAKHIGQKGKYEIQGDVGVDAEKDLALLKVESNTEPPLVLGNSDQATVGDTVFVVGNPRGLEGTLSEGIVSAVRTVAGGKLLQITAPLSPGSSGGPVINAQGQVIGVAAAAMSGGQNLNFAIPTSYLRPLLGSNGSVRPLTANSTRSAENSLVGRVGREPIEGVLAAQLSWWNGYLAFSIRNELSKDVTHVQWLVIFYGPDSKPIDSREGRYDGIIRAGLAARIPELTPGADVFRLLTRTTVRILDFEFVDDISNE